jgi:hypothetical protein
LPSLAIIFLGKSFQNVNIPTVCKASAVETSSPSFNVPQTMMQLKHVIRARERFTIMAFGHRAQMKSGVWTDMRRSFLRWALLYMVLLISLVAGNLVCGQFQILGLLLYHPLYISELCGKKKVSSVCILGFSGVDL